MTEQTGSTPEPQAPAPVAPATPTEPTPAPAPSPEPTPAPAPAAPAEGTPPASTPPEGTPPAAPAEPAPATPPPAPRESAQLKRAREAREKANGLLGLADKLDPQPAAPPAPAPAPPAPAAPTTPPADDLKPDYFDDEGNIDPDKHAAYTRRVAEAEARRIDADRQTQTAAAASRAQINAAVSKYADSVDSEAQYLVANVPELNPASPDYDADLDDHIEQAYKRATTDSQGNLVRIDISLKEFAEREVKLARKYRTNGAASVPNSQVAQGHDEALTPDNNGGQAPAKDPKDMTADEYEAYLIGKGVTKVQR